MNKRICFVIQRYGLEVNGGAELHCRQLAEHLLAKYDDIHVLTTKAIDYQTWKDEYQKDYEVINGIKVHRFGVQRKRDQDEFDAINIRFLKGNLPSKEEKDWIKLQGPYTPDLIRYLKWHYAEYDAIVFFTYLYYTTIEGMAIPGVRERAIVIPTAHDEPYLRLGALKNVFCGARAFLYNTEDERRLINERFGNEDIPSLLGGVGVDLPDDIDALRFKEKFGAENYIIYVGRIGQSKNCGQLFDCFLEYKKRNPGDLKLVLMGKPMMDIPGSPDIICTGFAEEQDKFDGIAGAQILVLPSEFESLSMVVLEAMSVCTPVMVYGKCDVLRSHCTKSNGAFYYNNYFEFEGQINYLLTHPKEKQAMTDNAYEYVQENYRWDVIVDRLSQLIERI